MTHPLQRTFWKDWPGVVVLLYAGFVMLVATDMALGRRLVGAVGGGLLLVVIWWAVGRVVRPFVPGL